MLGDGIPWRDLCGIFLLELYTEFANKYSILAVCGVDIDSCARVDVEYA